MSDLISARQRSAALLRAATETLDERAERLTRIGMEVAVRLRDEEDPADVRRVVDALPVDEVRDLAILLAAHVPVELPHSFLIGWWTHPRRKLAPCGTVTAAKRHQARKEPMCSSCLAVYREYERVRARQRYGKDRT